MRSTFTLFLAVLALPAFALDPDPKPAAAADAPAISTVTADTGTLPVDGFRVLTLANYKGPVSWETDPVYEIGYKDGKPVLVSGEMDYLEINEPAKIPERQGLKLIDVGPGSVVIWGKTPGKVRLVARGVVDGVPKRLDTVIIEVTGPRGPPLLPIEPGQPTTGLYFALVRANGPATEEVRRIAALPAWDDVRKAGHQFKDFTLSELPTKDGKSPIPDGTPLPCLLVLKQDGTQSVILKPIRPAPQTDDDVRKLLEIKP